MAIRRSKVFPHDKNGVMIKENCRVYTEPLWNLFSGQNGHFWSGNRSWISCQVITSFLLSSLFVAVGLLSTSRKQEENSKDTATLREESKDLAYKTRIPTDLRRIQIYFTEPLYALCIFVFPQPYFWHVSRVSRIRDDWLTGLKGSVKWKTI